MNPWQVPMGRATPQAMEIMGIKTVRVDTAAEVADAVSAAATMVFDGDQSIAVVISQKLIGRKQWVAK